MSKGPLVQLAVALGKVPWKLITLVVKLIVYLLAGNNNPDNKRDLY